MEEETSVRGENLGAMEFFILALIGRSGLNSLYELRREAGLEPGAVRSAMKTIENNNLISRSDPGKRRRRDLALTAAGTAILERSWQSALRTYPDADAVLRAAFVALVMDGPEATAAYLNHIGRSRREKAEQMKNEAEHLKNSQTGPLSSYVWMRVSLEAHRRGAESAAFLAMSGFIEEYFSNHASK